MSIGIDSGETISLEILCILCSTVGSKLALDKRNFCKYEDNGRDIEGVNSNVLYTLLKE